MKKFPLIYVYGGKVIDENGRRMKDWKERIERFEEVYVMDLDGISKNEPNLDFYQTLYRKKWIDSFPRKFEDAMDLVIAGADKIVIREGFSEKDLDRIFEDLEVEIYLSVSGENAPQQLYHDKWSGFVYLLDRVMDFKIKEYISTLTNIYIVARRRDYIDFDWIDERYVQGIVYPVWEMET